MRRIYLDHAATTPVHPAVREAMQPYLGGRFGNPSSLHEEGRDARRAVNEGRERVAAVLQCAPDEIIFTSGGTEADNLALVGVALAHREKGRHLVTSAVEHHAVLETARFLATLGFEVTFLPVDRDGCVDPDEVVAALRADTVLVSIMTANNEVGTVQPVVEIARRCRAQGVLFHTDAVQWAGAGSLIVDELGCDLLSLSAHKFYGPKGVGALYVREGVRIEPWLHGGSQETRRRAGTENVAGIVGLGAALTLAYEDLPEEFPRLRRLRDRLIQGVLASIPGARLTGHPARRLPGHASFLFPGAAAEAILMHLDAQGISASMGAACNSSEVVASHVLLAMGYREDEAMSAVRLTLGRETTGEDIERVLAVLPEAVCRARAGVCR